MSVTIFDGRVVAKEKKKHLKKDVDELRGKGVTPKLVSFYKAVDEGSALYTRIKKNAAIEVGFEFEDYEITTPQDVVVRVLELNEDESVHGILIQKPSGINNFPEEDWNAMICAIDPSKDVDGLTGKNPKFLPATAKAVLFVLEKANALDKGLNFVVVGDTDIIGRPLVKYLEGAGEKVRVANKFTQDLSAMTRNADVLVSATGVSDLINKDMVKEGAVVVDVGEPKGDVAEDVREVASFLSPVPGGVGPLTVVSLLENTQVAASYAGFVDVTTS